MGVLLLAPRMIIVIIGFNERGSQGEMMKRGTISYNWVKVWKYLTPEKNTSLPFYYGRQPMYAFAFKVIYIRDVENVCWHPAAQQMVR